MELVEIKNYTCGFIFGGLCLLLTASCGSAGSSQASGDLTYMSAAGTSVVTRSDVDPNVEYDNINIVADEVSDLYTDAEAARLVDDNQVTEAAPSLVLAKKKTTTKSTTSATGNSDGGGSVKIVITLSTQIMKVYENEVLQYTWPTSTGSVKRYGSKAATPKSPAGGFKPFLMAEKYHSKSFNVTLPYGIKFYGGDLIHAISPNAPMGVSMSHGCVRLHPDKAKTLFYMVKRHGLKNTRVVVQ